MGFCCADCGDTEHTCTAWDGKGYFTVRPGDTPNHNLVETCPTNIITCEYRKKKMSSKPIGVDNAK